MDRERNIKASGNVYNNCSSLLDQRYDDFGTVEGHLEAISAHGGYQVRIYEPVKSRSVTCHIGDDQLLETAVGFFRCRVEVAGEIRYSQDGWPISIRAETITKLPDSDALPSYKEMKGILRKVPNGKDNRYWDSDAFLGYFNQEADKVGKCEGVLAAAEKQRILIVTSALTLAEVLWIKGQPKMDPAKRIKIERFLSSHTFT